jgi:hypothetical protein
MLGTTQFTMPYHPALLNVWIPYTGPRYKDIHDLILKDGSVLPNYRPNANAWYKSCLPSGFKRVGEQPNRISDDDVAFIKLTSDEHLGEYDFSGSSRLEHNVYLFNGEIPTAKQFVVNEFRVIKSEEFDGYLALNNALTFRIEKSSGQYVCDTSDLPETEVPATLKTILDILNLNYRHEWPYNAAETSDAEQIEG